MSVCEELEKKLSENGSYYPDLFEEENATKQK